VKLESLGLIGNWAYEHGGVAGHVGGHGLLLGRVVAHLARVDRREPLSLRLAVTGDVRQGELVVEQNAQPIGATV